MFLYWDGYEIDGSATSFEMVLPEQHQVVDCIRDFLRMPLFRAEHPIVFRSHSGKDRQFFSQDEFLARLKQGGIEGLYGSFWMEPLPVQCLPDAVQKEIYALSAGRPGVGEFLEPTPRAPGADLVLGAVPFEFGIYAPSQNPPARGDMEGFVQNEALLLRDPPVQVPRISVCYGPSGYYEYAAYMMGHMQARYPDMGTYGGAGCGHGCTYGDSVYTYERFSVPVRYSVKNTLSRLLEHSVIQLPRLSKGENYWVPKITAPVFTVTPVNRVFGKLNKDVPVYIGKKPVYVAPWDAQLFSFAEYVELAEWELSGPHNEEHRFFLHTAETLPRSELYTDEEYTALLNQDWVKVKPEPLFSLAVRAALPAPEFFAQSPALQRRLEKALADAGQTMTDHSRSGYLTFSVKGDQKICEIWVKRRMAPYFTILLEEMEQGGLDCVKPFMYALRTGMRKE